jgi:hypothetical protein
MTPTTLAPPRRPPGSDAPPPVARAAARRWARPAHHGASRKVWRWAIAGSVLVHLLVLFLSPLVIRIGAPPGDAAAPPERTAAGGLRMVDIEPGAEVPTTTPPPTAARAPDVSAPVPADRRAAPTPPGAPAAPAERAAPAGANPLEPGIRDRRLWIAPRAAPDREPTQEELHAEYMAGLERRLQTWNDSIAGEADRARRATDWTVRDGKGGRWGVSPDGIHLGGVTLPPVEFPPGGGDPDRRRRAEEEQRTREALDRQEADTERRRVRDERIRATRERRDQERGTPP